MLDPNREFPAVEKLLYDLAWRTHHRYPFIPFEDCKSEAFLGCAKAFTRFNPRRKGKNGKTSKLSSLCFFLANCRLKSLVMKRCGHPEELEINEEIVGACAPERSPALEAIEDLSEDAREILSLLLETPAEIIGQCPIMTPKGLLRRVKRHLEACGKKRSVLNQAQQEIQTRLREVWASG